MIINTRYFDTAESKFRGIKRDTLKYVDIFEEYMKKHPERSYTFEDFMVTLANYLNDLGYSKRKIEKWYKCINTIMQRLATEVLVKKHEK